MVNPYDKIVELLKTHGITANFLAVNLGLNNTVFSQWKQGKSKPSLEVLIKIADYFEVTLDYLTGRTGDTVQNIGNGILIQGDNNNANNGATGLAQELLSVLDKLPNSKKALLLAKAYELLENN